MFAVAFGAYAVASVAQGEDVASVVSSAIAALIFAGLWYLVGWLQYR